MTKKDLNLFVKVSTKIALYISSVSETISAVVYTVTTDKINEKIKTKRLKEEKQ